MWKKLALKLTVPTLSMFLVVTLLATYVGKIFFEKNMLGNIYNDFNHYSYVYNNIIKDVTEEQNEINFVLINTSSIKKELSNCKLMPEDSCRFIIRNTFKGLDTTFNKIGFNFYDNNFNLLYSSSFLLKDFKAKDHFSTLLTTRKNMNTVIENKDSLFLVDLTPIFDKNVVSGWVMSYVSLGYVLRKFKGISKYNFVFLRKNHDENSFIGTPLEIRKALEANNTSKQNKLNKYVYEKFPVKINGVDVGILVMYSDFQKYSEKIQMFLRYLLLFAILALILGGVIYYLGIKLTIVVPIKKIRKSILELAKGNVSDKLNLSNKDEIGEIAGALNQLIDNFKSVVNYADELGKGNYDVFDDNMTEESLLGSALIRMKDNLKEARKLQEEKQHEEKIRHWIAEGLAKFGNILRKYDDDDKKTFDELINELADYTEVEQGAILIVEGDEDDKHLKIMSTYAYGRHKFREERIELGEGIAGEVALEGMSIYIDDLPEDYPAITSGLGEAKPKYLFVVPLKLEEEIFGVIELASFHPIDDYKREFVEKLGESIASVLKNMKVNRRTKELLTMFQEQSEEMHAQEEELKQNLEELQATQEDMLHKEREFNMLFNAIEKTLLKIELNHDSQIISINNIFTDILKYKIDEAVSKSIIDFLEDETIWFNIFSDIKNGIVVKEKLTLKAKDGNLMNINVIILPYLDENGDLQKIMIIGLTNK